MAIPIYLGIDVVIFSYGTGLLFLWVTLYFTYRTGVNVFGSLRVGLLAILLLGTNYSFSMYATGGLETQLQASLLTMIVYLLLAAIKDKHWNLARFGQISVLASLALMTRLDSAVFLAAVGPVALSFLLRDRVLGPKKMVNLAALALPFLLVVGGWFVWKLSFYGDLLPNTFYAKVGSAALGKNGIRFLGMFFRSYWLVPMPLLALLFIKRLFANVYTAILSGIVLLWCGYIIEVGGDFMEFRFLVPVLPVAFLLIAWMTLVCIRKPALQLVLFGLVFAGSVNHA